MPRNRREKGICHICGSEGYLTFEHLPPEKAFNDYPMLYISLEGFFKNQRYEISQRGAGGHTLCGCCNNNTGNWYGSTFVKWCKDALEVLQRAEEIVQRAEEKPTLTAEYKTYPLRILKQIVTMFFSANRTEFQQKHPELVKFVLNKSTIGLPPRYRFFVYYNVEGWKRRIGLSMCVRLDPQFIASPSYLFISEINFPPFGYVMTIDSHDPDNPDKTLCEITDLGRYDYDDSHAINLTLPILPTHTYLVGNYSSKREIEAVKQQYRDVPSLQRELERVLSKR